MDFYQRNIINGLTTYNLINITQSKPCGMSYFWYIFFIFIGIAQLYKIYINSRCIYKSFTIRKLISSRYSLSTEECDIKYRKLDPAINFEDKNITFKSNEFGHISNDFKLKLPTQEEIEAAQQYDDKIFNINNISDIQGNYYSNNELKNDTNENNNEIINSELNNSLKTGLLPSSTL